MNENAEAKQKSLTDKFVSQIRGREDELRSEYVKTNASVAPIAKQMNATSIEGIISCMEKRNLKDVARQTLTNVAGNAVGKLTGIGFKQTDNEEHYYLALTADKLHYLHFSEDGDCKEHLSFDRNRLENLESGKIAASEAVAAGGSMFGSLRLSFTYDGEQHKFFYFDKFFVHPSAEETGNADREFAEQNYLFAEPFLTVAASVQRES
jgi:alkyl sulfatase BDS1-like metallo-beta-lactamase superfamily hydrolase